jgi:hypothetical protein
LVVLADNFRTPGASAQFSVIGSNTANLATEGLSVGFDVGFGIKMNPATSLGASIGAASWFLPSRAEQTPLGDRTSLTGRTTMVSLMLTASYR